jgi:hypothetical protein
MWNWVLMSMVLLGQTSLHLVSSVGDLVGSGIGMISDTDGFDTGNDLRIDYSFPNPKERFVAGYNIGALR